MIGRGAIRNPWIFRQIRQSRRGEKIFQPAGRDVLHYIERLYEAVCSPAARESAQVKRLKKFLNYIGTGVDEDGQFLHQIRRADTRAEFLRVCETFLDHDQPMALVPFDREQPSPRQP
jgi:tRNA-dihydrouridine synthase B